MTKTLVFPNGDNSALEETNEIIWSFTIVVRGKPEAV